MGDFLLDLAQLVALFLEAVLYGMLFDGICRCFSCSTALTPGIYLISFFSCLRALLFSEGQLRSFGSLSHLMIIAALSMFAVATLDIATGLRHTLEAFIVHSDDPVITLAGPSWRHITKTADFIIMTSIGGAILVRRISIFCDMFPNACRSTDALWFGTKAFASWSFSFSCGWDKQVCS